MTRAKAGAIVAVAFLAACSSGPAGLGKQACPYLRPRIIRLDAARLVGDAGVIGAIDEDVGLYVKSNLPAGGKAKADRPVVAFSAALHAYATHRGDAVALDGAEAALKRECGVT